MNEGSNISHDNKRRKEKKKSPAVRACELGKRRQWQCMGHALLNQCFEIQNMAPCMTMQMGAQENLANAKIQEQKSKAKI